MIGSALFSISAQAYEDDCKPPKSSYAEVDCTTDGNYFIAKDKNYNYQALLNKQGKAVASLKGYDSVSWTVSDGVLAVMKNDKVGYINTQGKLVVPTVYDNLIDPDDKYDETWSNDASEGRIVVAKNGKWGFIDGANKTVIPFQYSDSNIQRYSVNDMGANYFNFYKGVAQVATINDKDICINKSAKKVACPN